jgi:AcrR family transcriptional regulator
MDDAVAGLGRLSQPGQIIKITPVRRRAEHGYDATTVAEIADRAGLTKSTFFRHFADKREVLFGGQDMLAELFSEAIRAAPPAAATAECLAAALAAAAVAFTPDRQHATVRA